MKRSVFWGLTPVESIENKPTFRRNKSPPSVGLKNDGGDISLRNVGLFSTYYTALYSRI
jgi:hypothetical protein